MVKPMKWTPDLVERFWDGVSQTRLSQLSFSKHNSEYLIDLIKDHLKMNGRHLDFGAGTGDLVKALIGKGYATAAYEPSTARSSCFLTEVAGHEKYLGHIGNDCNERFDVVLLIEVLEHILEQDLSGTLQKVKSLLADGGTVIISTPLSEDLELASTYCPMCDTLFHRWQHLRSFTPDSLLAFLSQYGFACLSLQQADFSYNRFVIEDLHDLIEKLENMKRQHQQTFDQRLKRRFGHRHEYPSVGLKSSLEGTPSHLIFIGRPREC